MSWTLRTLNYPVHLVGRKSFAIDVVLSNRPRVRA
jgi:hypothetical protein